MCTVFWIASLFDFASTISCPHLTTWVVFVYLERHNTWNHCTHHTFLHVLTRQYTQKSYSSPSETYVDKSSLYKWCRVWVGCGSFWRICTSRGGMFQKHRVWSIRYNGMGNLLALFKYTACWVVSDKVIGWLTLLRLNNAFQLSQLELYFNLCLITTWHVFHV